MTYLPSLIRKIDEFYKLAAPPEAWTMPDEPEEESSEEYGEGEAAVVPHFDDLMNISHQVDDPGLAQQLRVLAELYRYAINMGGGYATIAKAITNLKNMYSDGADSNIEFILNGMIKELSKQAGGAAALAGKDNPNFVQRLAQLKQDIEDRERSAQSGALDAYNEEVNAPGATEETAEELAESGLSAEEAEIVNPAALGFGDKDNPRTNKGWHTVGSGKPYKNWKEYYEAERASYEADFATETNPDIRNVLKELIDILPQLSELTDATLKLAGELKVAPSEQGEAQKAQMLGELQRLKERRQLLKNSIRSSTLQKDKQRLTEEMASTRDPKVQMLLEQQIALKDLALSNDVYKAKERNYRQALVDSMSGGNFPGLQTYQDFLQKIDTAKNLRISKPKYDAKQWAEQAGKEGRVPAARPGQRGGWGEGAKHINLDKATQDPKYFPLLVGRVGPGINTAVAGTSYYIAREKEGGRVELKPFIEEVSKAIRKKDEQAKFDAIRKLRDETNKYLLRKKSAMSDYELTLRFLPFLRKMQSMLDVLVPWQKDGVWQLDDVKTKAIQDAVVYLARLQKAYRAHGATRKANFNSLINELFPKIQNYLENNVLQRSYDAGNPYEEKTASFRTKLLSKIFEEQALRKMAQEAPVVDEVDKATADRLADDIFSKLFDNELTKLLGS